MERVFNVVKRSPGLFLDARDSIHWQGEESKKPKVDVVDDVSGDPDLEDTYGDLFDGYIVFLLDSLPTYDHTKQKALVLTCPAYSERCTFRPNVIWIMD